MNLITKGSFKKSVMLFAFIFALAGPWCSCRAGNSDIIATISPSLEEIPFTMHTSARVIKIDQSFKGTKILVFGTKPLNEDIVIIMQGPLTTIRLRNEGVITSRFNFKKPIIEFSNVPTLYHIYGTSTLDAVMAKNDIHDLHIGLNHTFIKYSCINCAIEESYDLTEAYDFLIGLLQEKNCLLEKYHSISLEGALYSGKFHLPVNVKDGIYSFTSYLGANSKLDQVKIMPLIIKKRGMGGRLFYLAHNDPYYYAMLAIIWTMLMAVVANLITAMLFVKNK